MVSQLIFYAGFRLSELLDGPQLIADHYAAEVPACNANFMTGNNAGTVLPFVTRCKRTLGASSASPIWVRISEA